MWLECLLLFDEFELLGVAAGVLWVTVFELVLACELLFVGAVVVKVAWGGVDCGAVACIELDPELDTGMVTLLEFSVFW